MSDANPVLCEHANEVPNQCACDAECYCKGNTCGKPIRGTLAYSEAVQRKINLEVREMLTKEQWERKYWEEVQKGQERAQAYKDAFDQINRRRKAKVKKAWEDFHPPPNSDQRTRLTSLSSAS